MACHIVKPALLSVGNKRNRLSIDLTNVRIKIDNSLALDRIFPVMGGRRRPFVCLLIRCSEREGHCKAKEIAIQTSDNQLITQEEDVGQ